MAQQITIDIVAETKKLTDGVNNANNQLTGLSKGLSGIQQQAVGLASAFILREGVSFLKKANEEAIDAEKTAKAAASAFGEGSIALQKITSDAEKFADELAIDNDEIIKLATGIGVRLPKDAQASSTELVLLAKNLEAASGGAIGAETTLSKLGKAFSDGVITAKELSKTIPGLTEETYKQAEALSKAGKNQEAMTLLVEAGAKKYGGAAADQVTGTQKMEKAMGDLYEMIGKNVAPIVEKLTKFISEMVDWVIRNKEVVIPLVTVLGGFAAIVLALNAGLTIYNGIMAAWKTATVIGTTVQAIFNAVMAANPIALVVLAIVALIAIIVLLVKNWDTVTEVVGKVWEAIKDFGEKAFKAIGDFVSGAIEKFKEFASNIKETVGNFVSSVVGKFTDFKDKITGFVRDVINKIKEIPGEMLDIGKNIVTGLWNGMKSLTTWLKNKIVDFFGDILPSWAKKALGISSPSKVFANIGKNVGDGLWQGLKVKEKSLQNNFTKYFGELIPQWAKDALQIASPSKVFEEIGVNITEGLYKGMGLNGTPGIILPAINVVSGAGTSAGIINVTVNAGLGTDPYILGREITTVLQKYGKVSARTI